MAESGGRKDEETLEIAASEARDRFGELIDRALAGERVIITRNGRRIAALISVRDADRYVAREKEAA